MEILFCEFEKEQTEKEKNSQERYSIVIPTLDIKDNITGKLIRGSEIAELLNKLSNEDDKLKQEIDSLRRQLTVYRKIKRLVKDND